jgi:2,4-dienoyl-CoA reductase-like NADH-dependent reductase (Old Yellow Enzyme family)/threonine dehydrogenase-like Zn-dependent dehydrogenase
MSAPNDLDVLWNPLQIGSVEVSNRIFVSAHMIAFGDEVIVPERYINYYEERARGGVGLLITGAEGVHPTGWHAPHYQAWREDAAPRYQRLADAVHSHGSRIFTQLWHAGLQDHGIVNLDSHHPVLAPSGVPSPVYGRIAKAMEREDIEMVIDAFGRCAELAQAAGIDGVEVAGAHGYLLNNFMSKLNNRRDDEYGGSPANRVRLAVEVGAEIRRRCGSDFPVGLRMIFEDFQGEGGFQPEDSQELLAEAHRAGVFDYFSISGGTYHSQWSMIMSMTTPLRTPYVEHAALAKRVVDNAVPIFVACGVYTVDQAAEIVSTGKADLVAMTRAHLADPELVNKAREGRKSETRRCIGANQGCVHRQYIGAASTCTVNPAVGREGRWGTTKIKPSSTPRQVVVVGGGPGGLKFADTAALRGHDVTLVERTDSLGGQVRLAAKLPGRERWLDFIEDISGSLERRGVTIEFDTEASVASLRERGADLTVLATGSYYDKSGFSIFRPDRDGIPGAGEGRVLDPIDVVTAPERCGDRVVLIDDVGDVAALALAQLLGEAGKEVHIVTMGRYVGMAAESTFDPPEIRYPALLACGVRFAPSTTVEAITDEGVSVVDVWTHEARTIPADTVVVNLLRKPNDELYRALRDEGLPVRRIGDCVAPRRVDEAVYEGMELGLDLEAAITASDSAVAAVR